jgi:hypothetical protein
VRQNLDSVARELVGRKPDEFAEAMLTMMFLKILHPQGLPKMTVVLGDRVVSFGTDDPKKRLVEAKEVIQAEIDRR